MNLSLFAHPFSSYCQKALTALYENSTCFSLKMLSPETPENFNALKRLWPIGKFPVLEDKGTVIFEATSIVEYLAIEYPGLAQLIPHDPKSAFEVRQMDRVFDNYVMTPMNWIVQDARRAPETKDPQAVAQGRALLDTTYRWLDQRMAGREWSSGGTFSLADCAAAPRYFMLIGPIRLPRSSAIYGLTEAGSSHARHLPGRLTKRGRIANYSRSARRIEIRRLGCRHSDERCASLIDLGLH